MERSHFQWEGSMNEIRYVCRFCNAAGEVREVLVELTPRELEDVERHRKEGHGCGSVHGPLAKFYAWSRAARMVPPEFVPIYEQARLVN
jgi:hypothetical protein